MPIGDKLYVKDLPLPKRVKRGLLNQGIISIEQLLKTEDIDILRISGIGKVGLKAIKEILELGAKTEDKLNFESTLILEIKGLFAEHMTKINQEINHLRTVVCEQYRLLQAIQMDMGPNSVLRKMDESVPGFEAVMTDLYKKLKVTKFKI